MGPPPLPDVPMGHEDASERDLIQGEDRGGSPEQGSSGSGIVEYPDGAPPEVIREMKEPETHDFELKRGSVKRSQTEVPTVSNRPMTMRRQGPIRAPTPVGSPDANVEGFGKTDGCPACQSGMVAPGIRHSSKCKRRFAEFEARSRGESRTALDAAVSEEERLERERSGAVDVDDEAHVTLPERTTPDSAPVAEDMEVELDESLTGEPNPESLVAYERRFKRPADVPTEQLEREMNEEVESRMDAL